MTIQELLTYIFQGQTNFISIQFEKWVKSSRRFRAFAETYRDKIRKKLRTVENDDALKSLYVELEIAYRLLGDQRIEIEYEKYGLGKQRAPDFTIQYRVNIVFNLEITRLRFGESSATKDQHFLARKLTDALLDKVGQMLPNLINVLLIDSDYPTSMDTIAKGMASLRHQAEMKQNDFFVGRGYQDALTFLKQFQQLSALCYRTDHPSAASPLLFWRNSLARHPVPKPIITLLEAVMFD
jgi:hypothetical protein